MRSKNLLFFFIALTGLAACSQGNRNFTVIGDVKGMPEQTIVLEQLYANDVIEIIDSQRSKADGHFEVAGISPEPGLYRLHFRPNKFILLSVDKGNVKVNAEWNALENYSVSGSPSSENLRHFVVAIREHLRDFNTMNMVIDTLETRGNDSILTIAKKDLADLRLNFTQFVEHYADTTPYLPNAVFAARMLNLASEGNYLSAFSQGLHRRFPRAKMAADFNDYYTKTSAKLKQPKHQTVNLENGAPAPEVALPGVDGKVVTLSSLRGKFVLLDFWASWCQPCRKENPNVVAAYKKYKNNNFTILGVSLDNAKEPWMKAIADDHLEWTHVCDFKGWASEAASTYSVQSIPSNFLIDTSGRIIGHNLQGEALEQKLNEIFSSSAPATSKP